MTLTTVLMYCANDHRFFKKGLALARCVSDRIVLTYSDHSWNGIPEPQDKIKEVESCDQIDCFIKYEYKAGLNPWGMEALARNSTLNSLGNSDYVLFLDVDEFIDAELFSTWMNSANEEGYYFSCYWYFREPTYRAIETESAPLMVKKDKLKDFSFRHGRGDPFFMSFAKNNVASSQGPMFHHYSWVRSREEMLQKVRSWGHKNDRDWVSLVNMEFSRPFNGRDFVHGYHFQTVKNPHFV